MLSLALTQPYQGRVAKIYFGTFLLGSLLQESSSFILLQDGSKINLETSSTNFNELFSGYMDQMNIQEGAETSTIELMVENKLIDLERARVARFTSGYQKSVYPGDLGCDFIEDLQDKKYLGVGQKVMVKYQQEFLSQVELDIQYLIELHWSEIGP